MRAITFLAVVCVMMGAALGAERKPNIILIVADDLGYADLGAQGIVKDVRTPNIDSIARDGVRFTNAYVSCPVCSPTRAGLMTGRYQERFGHEMNPGGAGPENFGLPLDQVTLPQTLRGAGYKTGMTGKWHLGSRAEMMPTKRGFDEFFGFLGGAHSYVKDGEGRNAIMRGTEPVAEKEYLTDALGREAVAFVERHHDEPFFLYLPFNAVHQPQEAPEKYQKRFAEVKDEKRKLMLAMLSAEDDAIGRLLETLRKHQLEENTLIFFHSDNGGPTAGNGSRNTPLSGYKGQVWEGGIRIPFLMQWKGHIKGGNVIDQPVISLDIFPTACAAAGAPVPSDRVMDGLDLMPLVHGQSDAKVHDALYWRFGPQAAMRSGDLKLVKFEGQADRMFDLSKDIAEKEDLAAAKPDVLKEMQAKYEKWNKELKPPLWEGKGKQLENRLGEDSQQQRKAGGKGKRRAK